MIEDMEWIDEAPGTIPPVPQMYPAGPTVLGFLYALILSLMPSGPTNVVTVTGDDTLLTTDNVVLADATSAALTVTLPTAVGNAGVSYNIKKIDTSAHAVTVKGAGAELIDTANTQTIDRPQAAVQVVSDNVQWWLL